MNALEQQTLFEIAMAIGQGSDMQMMLQSSLSVMLRKLGCNTGAVVSMRGDGMNVAHSIPHRIKNVAELERNCREVLADPTFVSKSVTIMVEQQQFVFFHLPEFGILVLGKSGDPLSKGLRGALAQIAKRLAIACIACEQARAVKDAQQHTELILESAAEGICGIDLQGRCTFANASFIKIFGYLTLQEIIGKALRELILARPYGEKSFVVKGSALFSSLRYKQKIHSASESFLRSDGSHFPVEYWSTPIMSNGAVSGAVVTFIDITDRKRAQIELQTSEARMASLIRTIPDLIWMKDTNGCFLACNPMFERFFGASESEIIGKTDFDFIDRELACLFRENDLLAIAAGKPVISEERVRFADDGHLALLETIKAPTFDASGKLIGVIGIARDITDRKVTEERITNLAFYDSLTGLPNRRLVLDRLQHALINRSRTGREGALLFLDLDNFKELNDSMGHAIGDMLLQQVAERLKTCIRHCDTAARFGGDEFVIMLEDLSENQEIAAAGVRIVGDKILHALNQSYDLEGHKYHNTPSIGVTLFADCENSVDELMRRADLAMYQAKAVGRNTIRFYDPQMQAAVTKRTVLEKDLRDSLEQQHFLLFYQPQVNADGLVTGAEALVRWQHPSRGMVSPAEFIPVAELTGLILPLGQWVLETACAQLALWAIDPTSAHLSLAVNVSARQFKQEKFVEQVLSTISSFGANPERLKLELTESMLLDDIDEVIVKMSELKAKGVGFSLDDFGTGYSSLSYLKLLPLDQLKIDQSFVRDVLIDPHDAAISQAIVTLGQSLGLAVIAEGVETDAQRQFLEAHGCMAYQGYFFSRPLPIDQFNTYLEQKLHPHQ